MSTITVPLWTLGDHLRKARERAGLSQQQMADELGIARRSVTSYENDATTPNKAVMRVWAEVCNVPYEWISRRAVTWLEPDGPDDGGTSDQGDTACRCIELFAAA